MGSTHAVDILLAILLARKIVEESIHSVLPGNFVTFLIGHNYDPGKRSFWELFSGTGTMSEAYRKSGQWNVMTPMDIKHDKRCDLL